MRSLARSIEVSPALLSLILRGKQRLTVCTAKKISRKLPLADEVRADFLRLVAEEQAEPILDKRPPPPSLREEAPDVICDWYHLAILNLIVVDPKNLSAARIGKRLGISTFEAGRAMLRLERAGYIKKTAKGFERVIGPFVTTEDIPGEAIRRFHRQVMALASRSLDSVSVSEREITTTFLPTDPAKLVQLKRRVRKFRSEIESLLESGKPQRVYAFAIQCFPVDRV